MYVGVLLRRGVEYIKVCTSLCLTQTALLKCTKFSRYLYTHCTMYLAFFTAKLRKDKVPAPTPLDLGILDPYNILLLDFPFNNSRQGIRTVWMYVKQSADLTEEAIGKKLFGGLAEVFMVLHKRADKAKCSPCRARGCAPHCKRC